MSEFDFPLHPNRFILRGESREESGEERKWWWTYLDNSNSLIVTLTFITHNGNDWDVVNCPEVYSKRLRRIPTGVPKSLLRYWVAQRYNSRREQKMKKVELPSLGVDYRDLYYLHCLKPMPWRWAMRWVLTAVALDDLFYDITSEKEMNTKACAVKWWRGGKGRSATYSQCSSH